MTSTQIAVLMPVLLFWIMLIVQFGLWYHAKQVADAAAFEGVEVARAPSGTAEAGEQAARDVMAQSGNVHDISVELDRGADVVRVVVSAAAPQLVPGFSWSVSASAEAPAERFVSEAERP